MVNAVTIYTTRDTVVRGHSGLDVWIHFADRFDDGWNSVLSYNKLLFFPHSVDIASVILIVEINVRTRQFSFNFKTKLQHCCNHRTYGNIIHFVEITVTMHFFAFVKYIVSDTNLLQKTFLYNWKQVQIRDKMNI